MNLFPQKHLGHAAWPDLDMPPYIARYPGLFWEAPVELASGFEFHDERRTPHPVLLPQGEKGLCALEICPSA